VPADKKISGDITEPQILDANFIQIQWQTGLCEVNLSFSIPYLKSEAGP
jgi:hypothetical protein